MSSIITGSGVKAALSASGVLLLDKYNGARTSSEFMAKRAGYQAVSSFFSNTLEGYIRPMLPVGWQISSMYMKPLVVGGSFTVLCAVIDGQKNMTYVKYNLIVSILSELGAGYLEAPIDNLLKIGPSQPTMVVQHRRF